MQYVFGVTYVVKTEISIFTMWHAMESDPLPKDADEWATQKLKWQRELRDSWKESGNRIIDLEIISITPLPCG